MNINKTEKNSLRVILGFMEHKVYNVEARSKHIPIQFPTAHKYTTDLNYTEISRFLFWHEHLPSGVTPLMVLSVWYTA